MFVYPTVQNVLRSYNKLTICILYDKIRGVGLDKTTDLFDNRSNYNIMRTFLWNVVVFVETTHDGKSSHVHKWCFS